MIFIDHGDNKDGHRGNTCLVKSGRLESHRLRTGSPDGQPIGTPSALPSHMLLTRAGIWFQSCLTVLWDHKSCWSLLQIISPGIFWCTSDKQHPSHHKDIQWQCSTPSSVQPWSGTPFTTRGSTPTLYFQIVENSSSNQRMTTILVRFLQNTTF